MPAILGISAFYHDSAAALLVDGKIVAAAQEERFTRKRHDAAFPAQAIEYCLNEAGLRRADLAYIAFYDKPFAKFERLLETYVAFAPGGFASFSRAIPIWLKEKLHLRRFLRREFREARSVRLVFTDHHESHAASAFFPSPFDSACILTLDGVGEWSTSTLAVGQGNRFEFKSQMKFPHSLGLLYSAFTYYCGFKVNSGEYKLMGLAPYGRPQYAKVILEKLLKLKDDGSFWMDMRYFDYCAGLTMTNRDFDHLFGGPPRKLEETLTQRHMDIAASVQAVTEDIFLRMARHAHQQTGMKNLVLAGGVALNCVANGRLLREGPFEKIWIQPAAGDAGGALGAALFVWHQLLENPRKARPEDSQNGSLLGPAFSNREITDYLAEAGLPFGQIQNEADLLKQVSKLLADGNVVGWFHGRMEFGPRALGARSILADPRNPSMQATLNQKIKFRESFRPFAPAVLRERVSDYFDVPIGQESPYMLLVAPVQKAQRGEISASEQKLMENDPDLRKRVNVIRSTLPAVTHVDYSARLQTVDEGRHGRFYRLLKTFESLTGCGVLVNTSFNVRGEPIVCTPRDACECFLATEMDALVLEDCLLLKEDLPQQMRANRREEHLARFQRD